MEVVIGRSAARVILALAALALGAALALSGSGHAKEFMDLIRRLPAF